VIPIPISTDEIGAAGGLRRCSCSQPGSRLGEGFCLGLQGVLQDGAVLGLGRPPGAGSSAFERLNEAVIQAADDKLAQGSLQVDITI
jgi:hypothetical protein